MRRSGGLRPSHVYLLKRLILLAVVVAAAYIAYRTYLARRPPLPQVGAEQVAQAYLTALQSGDFVTALSCVSAAGQSGTNALQMGDQAHNVYASVDNWTLAKPTYAPTHLSASVPVVIYYKAAWAPEDQAQITGNLDFDLEDGNWRLRVALPFITAITKQREEQHFGGG
jgi:hypothetical protein